MKEKFDEIFDSAKFNKALEAIMKLIKELKQKVQVLREQRISCQLVVSEVEDKETKLEDNKKRLENTQTKINDIKTELEPINQKIQRMERLDTEYKNLVADESNVYVHKDNLND